MESSYWKYLSVHEKEEWANLKGAGESDEDAIARLIDSREYNPLEDTRPYYYATYNDVRGTSKLLVDASGARGSQYVLDGQHDEHQLNSQSSNVSFLGILNAKTVLKCKSRTYDTDRIDGGDVYH